MAARVETRETVGMAAKLAPPVARVTYPTHDPVARALAPMLALTEGSAHQVLVGNLPSRVAAVIDAHLAVNALDRLTRWMKPIHDAENRMAAPQLTPALIAEAMGMDGNEDLSLVQLASSPADPMVAKAALRAIYHEISVKQRLAAAICNRHGLVA